MSLPALSAAQLNHFLNGRFSSEKRVESLPVRNPCTGEVIAEVPAGSACEVESAVDAASAAQPQWARQSPGTRANLLLQLADALAADSQALVQLESLNAGKPHQHAAQEVRFAIDLLRFCAGAGRCLEGKASMEYLPGYTSILRREPIGIVAGITPWNYPIVMLAYKLGPALATGNCFILKPAEQTPLSALLVAKHAAEILPAGVFNVITGDERAGRAIVEHPDIRLISLTGSTATGIQIARAAAPTLKRLQLELGGKAPLIVCSDADLDAVLAGIRKGAFYNAGQDCTAATRILVDESLRESLIQRLAALAGQISVGNPHHSSNIEMGPLISDAQRTRVAALVSGSTKDNATIIAGGHPLEGPGYFFAPTVIANVQQAAAIVQEEVFGPVITVQGFHSEAEAIALANGTPYGLGASVWTRDLARALRISQSVQAGAVWVNCHDVVTPEMPHGGVKASGYGKDLSMYALEEYTHIKHVMINTNAEG